MSTSAAAYSALMLSPAEFARFMSELESDIPGELDAIFQRDPAYSAILRHYIFLSQSLTDLEQQVERHQAEQHFIFDRIIEAGVLEPQLEPHIRNFRRQKTRRYRYHPDTVPEYPSSSRRTPSPIVSYDSNIDIDIQVHPDHRRRSHNEEELGTKGNPIYISDENEVQCGGCGDGGHTFWDCTKEYRFDEERQKYVPIHDGDNLMEQRYVVNTDNVQSQ